MSKTEQALIDAIEANDKDKALDLFEKFQELKATTDIESNKYWELIDKIGEVIEEVKEVESVVETVKEEVSEVIEEVKVREVRGKKPNSIPREEIIRDFNSLLAKCVDFHQQVKRDRTSDNKFSIQMIKRLTFVKKILIR